MSKFKIGDRVRWAGDPNNITEFGTTLDRIIREDCYFKSCFFREGTVYFTSDTFYDVTFGEISVELSAENLMLASEWVAPHKPTIEEVVYHAGKRS